MWKQNLKPRSGRCHVGEESLEGTVFSWGHEGSSSNYARAPHCEQNEPCIGAPQLLQKFRPVGGGGGMIGGADATALGRADSSADPTNCTSASGGESAPLALERMYKKAPTPIAARTATPATAPPMIPADAASAPPLPPLPPEDSSPDAVVVGVPTLVVVTPSKSSSTPASVAALLTAALTSAVELLEIALVTV